MKAIIVSYKRGRHLIHPRHALIMIPGVESRVNAQALVGKKVSYSTKGGKLINGVITRPHGVKGLVRARFTKGLPGQAIGSEILIQD